MNEKKCEVKRCECSAIGRKKEVDSDLYGIIVLTHLCREHGKRRRSLFWNGTNVMIKPIGWKQITEEELEEEWKKKEKKKLKS